MAGALIGALRVSLSAETTAFEAGMNRSQAIAKRTAANLNTAFGGTSNILERTALRFAEVLTLAAIVRAGKEALEYAGHLGELADTLGLTTKDLQTFSYAAGQVGVSQEELQVGIQKLTISMGQAEVGAKKQIAAFKAIGISVDDLKGKTTGDVFREIAEKLEKVSDRSQRAAVEVALFGKAGAKLDNLLSGAQGTLSELSDAAEKLGIVLSDKQIQDADRVADKLEALKTVLKANIASAVANNANAIYGLIDALSSLISKLPSAIRAYQAFVAGVTIVEGKLQALDPTNSAAGQAAGRLRVAVAQSELRDLRNQQAGGASFADRAAALRQRLGLGGAPAPKLGGGKVGDFLGGGGGKAKKDHSGEDLERKQLAAQRQAFEFQRGELDAQKNILEAKKDLATDYVEQTTLSIDILNLERQQYKADLDNQVAENNISKGKEGISQAQADHLLALYDQADHDKRQKILNDEQEQRQRDVGELIDHDFERRKEILGKLADLATTQSERRKIELDLLDLAYQEKKQALQRILNESKNAAEIEDARRDLANLNKNYSLDRQGVLNRTRSPLEEAAASVPRDAAAIKEAFQSIEVDGVDSLADAIAGLVPQITKLGGVFGNVANQIISDIIRMTIRMLLFRAISSIFGGSFSGGISGGYSAASAMNFSNFGGAIMSAPKFASGGSFNILGNRGRDQNVLGLNGIPIANVNYGERLSIGNDNGPSRGGPSRVVVELRDEMLDARIADGSGVQIARAYPAIKAGAVKAVREASRRR